VLNFGGLTEADFAELEKSWIDRDTAIAAHLARVTDEVGREMFGGGPASRRAGVMFPYVPLAAGAAEVRGYRLRVDHPDTEKRADGTTKIIGKYRAARGSSNMLYCAPDARAALASDVPVVITEGEKKGLALWRLARHGQAAGDVPRWAPVALSGVWNWRGRTGESTDEDTGEVHAMKGPISDWSALDLESRKVIILFDADVRTNDSIRNARARLAEFLIEEKLAEVHLMDVPKSAGVKGVDDWIAAAGPEVVLAAIERDAKPYTDTKKKKGAGGDILAEVSLFRTRTRETYAQVPVRRHHEIMRLNSTDFENWIVRKHMERSGDVPNEETIKRLLRQLRAMASTSPPTEQVFLRLGSTNPDEGFSIDLGGSDYEAVNVSAAGWSVGRPNCKFMRSAAMLPLPRPAKGGNWAMLERLVNSLDPENFVLMVAWLVGSLAPSGPYPILMVSGEKGSAKSTSCEVLRRIVDPVEAGRRSLPDDERSLLIEAMNTWIVAFDNLSGLSRKVSDWLCRISTGGGSSQRRLHSNDEQVILSAMRPMLLNGIVDLGTYPDLLSRGLAVELPKLPNIGRLPETEINRLFLRDWPALFGLLLDCAVDALKFLPHVNLPNLPRMGDFTRWVYAAALGGRLPFTGDEFLAVYEGNRTVAFNDTLEAAPFARSVQRLMELIPIFEGTAEELRMALNEKFADEIKRYRWSSSNQALGNEMKDMAEVIRGAGLEVERFRSTDEGRRRLIRIARVSDAGAPRAAAEMVV
jgi:hypothetical protein